MSPSVPPQQSTPEAARSDLASTPPADRPFPDVPPHAAHSPIEREIERSERACAALAATRALARAAFTDSELAADDAADIDTAGWVRTEYAALDQSVRTPQEDVPHGGRPQHLVGGSFDPGIASRQAGTYLGASLAQAPIQSRGGAQARFMHEARRAPRAERAPLGAVRSEVAPPAATVHYDKPAVLPMLATPKAGSAARAVPAKLPTPAVARTRRHKPPSEPVKFALAVGVGAVLVLMGGGLAWKAGWLSRPGADNAGLITPQVAAQAEAARILAAGVQQIPVAPAAGTPATRSRLDVDAALAAAARAAAVPMASVHAAGPARVARSLEPSPVMPAATRLAAPAGAAVAVATTSTSASTAPAQKGALVPHGKDGVAAAIASAQARADSFLASGHEAPAAAPVDLRQEP